MNIEVIYLHVRHISETLSENGSNVKNRPVRRHTVLYLLTSSKCLYLICQSRLFGIRHDDMRQPSSRLQIEQGSGLRPTSLRRQRVCADYPRAVGVWHPGA